LQVPTAVVGKEDVDCFARGAGIITNAGDFGAAVVLDGMVNALDYIGMGSEERICFDFFKGLGDRFLPKRAADFLEGVEGGVGCILDKIDVRKATLGETDRLVCVCLGAPKFWERWSYFSK